ncbi:hypothetical protein DAPPUDRAFT_332412 [Daphnia pulex]|uniref:Uncharacterized protein n=1 Tax=Daphnia pulex TaxID=6669 RepID=E9HPW4_DAPPU|nr:hypothetical protein DAPPUDRAFT_332412 [Daphnia pulex]|eukprot:EFX66231.1 hypothetical protein DAPPUDRAFT_332412 [Daphnia pulex]
MGSDDDPLFPDDFHGFDDDSSSRRGRRFRDRSPSRSKSRDRFLSPYPIVELPASALDVVSRQRSHRLRKWMVEGLAKDTSKSLRESFKLKFEGSFELQCPKVDESMVRHLKNAKSDRSGNRKVDFVEKAWLSSQYQVMDAMSPLLHLWINLPDNSPLMEAAESALQLMGGAFANISKMRRLNVMRQVAPKMTPLLDDPRVFSPREISRLFGNKFLDAMVKEVEEEHKLAKIGRAGGPSDRSWSSGNDRWGNSRVFRGGDRGHSSGGNRYHPFNQQYRQQPRGQQSRYVNFDPPVSLSGVTPAVGARLLNFAAA